LAPKIVGEVFKAIDKLKTEIGLTILLVEQDVKASLAASDMVYILHEGRVKAHGKAEDLEKSREIREAYLGI
jgi:ABC-type branched-subunit amino acid transport system ATPase component